MFTILEKEELAPIIKKMIISAPLIAKKAKAGQFVILRVYEKGERIPLTISDKDPEKGTITIIFQEAGKTTKLLGNLKKGEAILDVAGPLGKPTHIENFGNVVAVGGGVGTAVVYPIVKALKNAGNKITMILGARSADLLILEEELKKISDEFFLTTDDGTKGEKGFVSDVLKRLIEQGNKFDLAVAIGPLPMMKVVCGVTSPYNIKTIVSLNPIMVDGTGMCGACRVTIDGKTKFTCVDGPEFDGHKVDWDELRARQCIFIEEEKKCVDLYNKECSCSVL